MADSKEGWVGMLSVSRMTSHNKQTYYDAFRFVESDDFDTTYLARHQVQAFEQEWRALRAFSLIAETWQAMQERNYALVMI